MDNDTRVRQGAAQHLGNGCAKGWVTPRFRSKEDTGDLEGRAVLAISLGLKWPILITGLALLASPAATQSVTFYRDVLPILQKSCQECHRPGEVGPMPLLTYEEARKAAPRIGRR